MSGRKKKAAGGAMQEEAAQEEEVAQVDVQADDQQDGQGVNADNISTLSVCSRASLPPYQVFPIDFTLG